MLEMDMIGDCHHCPGWKRCIGKDYYFYSEIRFCRYQIYWILQHAETLHHEWPAPDQSDSAMTEQYATEAAFVKPVLIITEVEERLKSTGACGEHLRDMVKAGIWIEYLSRNPRDALNYISGKRRKDLSFSKWRYQKEQRKMKSKSLHFGGLDRILRV